MSPSLTPKTLVVTAIAMLMIAPAATFATAEDPLPNEAPVAVLLAPASATIDTLVTLDGTGSSDIDGTVASYEFTVDGVAQASQATPTLDVTFATLGTHTVDLFVIDDLGASSATVSASIDVIPVPLARIEITGPATVGSGEDVTYTSEGFDALDALVFTRTVDYTGAVDLGADQVCDTEGDVVGCLDIEVVIGPLDHITVTATRTTVNIGRTSQVTARGFDVNGHEYVGMEFALSATRGTVTSGGLFTGKTAGPGKVTATSGSVSGSVNIRVTPTLSVAITIDDAFQVLDAKQGVTGSVKVGFVDGANAVGGDAKIFFTDPLGGTSAPIEVVLDSNGEADFSSGEQFIPGEYVVSVQATSGANYGANAASYVVYVVDPAVI